MIVKLRIVQQRLIPMAMEPRATVAQWDRGTRQLTVWSATQMPHILRTHLAEVLRLPENHVRVIAPEVGGGFGAKLNIYREEILGPVSGHETRQARQMDPRRGEKTLRPRSTAGGRCSTLRLRPRKMEQSPRSRRSS